MYKFLRGINSAYDTKVDFVCCHVQLFVYCSFNHVRGGNFWLINMCHLKYKCSRNWLFISGTKSNRFLEWYENIVRLNSENYTVGIRCALSYHVWSLFFPLFNIIIMYFFFVVVVLECRPGYFRVIQEMYWTWYLHDSISQRAESVARSYKEHWNSQGWYRLE